MAKNNEQTVVISNGQMPGKATRFWQEVARRMHETYMRLAPQYGHKSQEDRVFDPESSHGRLLTEVCRQALDRRSSEIDWRASDDRPQTIDALMEELEYAVLARANGVAGSAERLRSAKLAIRGWANSRPSFEAWAQSENLPCARCSDLRSYLDPRTQAAWSAWQVLHDPRPLHELKALLADAAIEFQARMAFGWADRLRRAVQPRQHNLVIVGKSGDCTAYLDMPQQEALARWHRDKGGEASVREFMFYDEFSVSPAEPSASETA